MVASVVQRRVLRLGISLALAGAACDGNTGAPPVRPAGEDAGRAAPVDLAPPSRPVDASPAPADTTPSEVASPSDVVADALPLPDVGAAPVAQPLPAGTTPPQRLFGPEAQLAGDGLTACSHEGGGPGPSVRWCVFTRPGTAPAATELWVMNVSKAATGAVPACDGSSADCVRLTTTLWTGSPLGGPSHPFSHQFNGDTLIYYADAPVGGFQDLHRGPVFAWRPGWTSPRVLTSGAGLMCFGHPRKPLAYCLDDLIGDPMHPDSFELRAGSVAAGLAGPLPSLGRVRPFRNGGAVAWQAGFSPDGALFAVSSPDPDPATEVLRVVATADLGTQAPREILQGAGTWSIADDGRRIYYLREDVMGSNTVATERGLYAASFPEGAGEVRLGSQVLDYVLLGEGGGVDRGVSFTRSEDADHRSFHLVRDGGKPESQVTLFAYEGILEDLHTSPDLRFTAWLDEAFTGRVVRHDGAGGALSTCRLNQTPDTAVFEPLFLEGAGLMFWNEDLTGNSETRDGFYGDPTTCQAKGRFAARVGYYAPIGDRGLVYTDEADATHRMTLKYAPVTGAGADRRLGPPVRVHDKLTEGQFTVIGTPAELVLFSTAEPGGGTFVFGPLPF